MTDTTAKTARIGEARPAASDDDLQAQMQAVRAEIAALTDVMRTFVKDKVHAFGATAQAAADDASARASKVRESVQHGVAQAEEALDHRVQQHPLQSILMAFGLGMLVSLLFRR